MIESINRASAPTTLILKAFIRWWGEHRIKLMHYESVLSFKHPLYNLMYFLKSIYVNLSEEFEIFVIIIAPYLYLYKYLSESIIIK